MTPSAPKKLVSSLFPFSTFWRFHALSLLDGEDPPEKVGCRKESYFLEFVYVDVVRDVIGVVFHVLLDWCQGLP